jgi:hypothetical protein
MHHWSCHAARWVARSIFFTVLEEAERAIVKVEQHAHTIILLHTITLYIVAILAVAAEGAVVSADEPAVGAFPIKVVS